MRSGSSRALGYGRIAHDQFLASFGQRNDSIIPLWLSPASTPERIARISETKEEVFRDLVCKNGITPLPGVAAWVHRLHESGWTQAVASAAPRADINVILDALGAAHCLQCIVSADDVYTKEYRTLKFSSRRIAGRRAAGEVHRSGGLGRRRGRSAARRDAEHRRESQRGHLPADIVVRSLDLLDLDAFDHCWFNIARRLGQSAATTGPIVVRETPCA